MYKLTFEFFACFNNICLASHAEYVSPGILFCISSLLNFLLALIISVWQVMRNTFRLVFVLYKLTFEFFAGFNSICLASHAEYVSPGFILYKLTFLILLALKYLSGKSCGIRFAWYIVLYKLTFEFFACFNNICLASHAEYVSPGIFFV